jgi:hypothetical protein
MIDSGASWVPICKSIRVDTCSATTNELTLSELDAPGNRPERRDLSYPAGDLRGSASSPAHRSQLADPLEELQGKLAAAAGALGRRQAQLAVLGVLHQCYLACIMVHAGIPSLHTGRLGFQAC